MSAEQSPEEERAVIICAAVEAIDPTLVVDDAVTVACGFCGCDVWLAPSGVDLRDTQNAVPCCWTCGEKVVEEDEIKEVRPLTPLQIKEIENHIKRLFL